MVGHGNKKEKEEKEKEEDESKWGSSIRRNESGSHLDKLIRLEFVRLFVWDGNMREREREIDLKDKSEGKKRERLLYQQVTTHDFNWRGANFSEVIKEMLLAGFEPDKNSIFILT